MSVERGGIVGDECNVHVGILLKVRGSVSNKLKGIVGGR